MQRSSRRLPNRPRPLGLDAGHPERNPSRTSLPKLTVNARADPSLLTTHLADRHNTLSRVNLGLPVELLVMIASYMRNNFTEGKGLLKFSLVCRHWRDVAQQFVFDALTISSVTQELEVAAFLVSHPDHAKWVHSLTYIGPIYSPIFMEEPDAWHTWFGDRPKLSGFLPNLFALTMRSFWGPPDISHVHFLQDIGRGFSSVKKLTLESCLGRPDDFSALISNFDKLEALSLKRITALVVDPTPVPSCALSRLTSLDMIDPGMGMHSVVSCLTSLQSVRHLKLNWDLILTPVDTTASYLKLLSQENVRIDSLTLCFAADALGSYLGADILTAADFLRAFDLPSLWTTHTFSFESVSIRAVSTMLNAIASRHNNIRRVRIELTNQDNMLFWANMTGSKEVAEHCGFIDQVLSRREFLNRGIKLELSNCISLRKVCGGNGMKLQEVELSQSMFPRLAHEKALITFRNPKPVPRALVL